MKAKKARDLHSPSHVQAWNRTKMEKIRTIIADDHPVFLIGMKAMLSRYEDVEIVGTAKNGIQACEKVAEEKPDVILLDVIMPEMDGIDATKRIRQECPDTKILILSSESSQMTIETLLHLNIAGFISKNADISEIICAIRSVYNGIPYFGTDILTIVDRINKARKDTGGFFTAREMDVIRLSCEGLMSKEIADNLGIARKTVDNIKATIFEKLGINTTVEIVRYAFASGLISL